MPKSISKKELKKPVKASLSFLLLSRCTEKFKNFSKEMIFEIFEKI